MLDRDSSIRASSSVSEPFLHHVLHLEEEAKEWKDRIEDLNISLSRKTRGITNMTEALTSMRTQKTRVQALLQKLDANMQKTLTQGREMVRLISTIPPRSADLTGKVAQKKVDEAEKAKLEQRLKERSELIEYIQDCRPPSSTPAPTTKPITPPAKKPAACPITHYDCPDCGCRMRRAKKEAHINKHCWGRCKCCAKEGLACNGGLKHAWSPCFQCGQNGVACVKPARTRKEAEEILRKGRGRVDSLVA